MTQANPGASIPRRPSTSRKYISARAEELLRDCFPGMIPARVIEEALRQKAVREGRLQAPNRQRSTS